MENSALQNSLNGLLANLGVAPAKSVDKVEDIVAKSLAECGIDAEIVSLRYKKLVLQTDPLMGELLRFDKDKILSRINKEAPGEVSSITVRIKRN